MLLDARNLTKRYGRGEAAVEALAIARALFCNPAILLADEPTGALDSGTGREILSLFRRVYGEGRTIVLVTHDEQVARHAARILRLQDGELISDESVAPEALGGTAAEPGRRVPRHEPESAEP